MNNNTLTLAQIVAALKRHKIKAIFTWLMVTLFVAALFVVWPRQYGSEGTLYVLMGRNNASITPTSGSASVMVQDTRETEIRSVLEMIKSRAVLESVAEEIGPEVILKSKWSHLVPEIKLPSFLASEGDDGMSIEEYNKLKKKEAATRKLEKSITVHAEKKTSIISVFVKASSAKLAQKIVNRIFEQTRKVHLKIHAAKGSAVFFDEQFDSQEQNLVKAVNNLAKFRNEKEFLSVGAARDTLQNVIGSLDGNLVNAEVAQAEAEKRLEKLQLLISQTAPQIAVPTKGVERLSFEDSRTELFKLESERERLVATYHEQHPEVIRVESQLKRVKESLEGMAQDRTESAMASNPVFEDLKVDCLRAEAEKAAADSRVNALAKKKLEAVAQMKRLNQDEIEADQLQRDVDIARQYLGIFTQKRGEAKALSSLDDRKISDVVVAQEANFNVKHVAPKGSLVLPLGFIAGLLGALAMALFCDRNHLSGTLNESEVEQVLDLPVLVTLPRVYSTRNMVN
jgi:uncharacterized protein involved in exopolysaccharide biosynthesis